MAKYVKTEDGYTSKYDIGLATVEDMISIASATSAAQATADLKMNADNPVGTGSFSMGRKDGSIIGQYSHAEGYNTSASGLMSHAEGEETVASGYNSHAEGKKTSAYGAMSHAEGYNTSASGQMSHAEGEETVASGDRSHAEGYNTRAYHRSQHVQGEYNITDTTGTLTNPRGTYAHIVGNGYGPSERSNAHTLDWSGNAWFAGDVYTGSTSGTNKDAGSKKLATEEYVDNKVSDFGGIQSPTNAKVGQTIVVKAIDENGKPTEWEVEDKPDKLPNPNALTFTGAVTGSYDGSAPLSVNIPQGGGGGSVETYTGEYELIVDHTVTAEEASASSFTFTKDAYPLINGQKLLVLVIEMPDTVSMPWSVLKAGNDDVIWNSNGTANCIRGFSAVLYNRWFFKSEFLTNKNVDTYLPATIAIIANRDPSFRSNPYKEYTSITLYSYVAFLAEGTVIKIYGGK